MMFCKKCSSIMMPQKAAGKTVMKCSCGYKSSEVEHTEIKEVKKVVGNKENWVLENHDDQPTVDAHCKKCSHSKAIFWEKQTRAADESPTRFFKCAKCGHTWREYS